MHSGGEAPMPVKQTGLNPFEFRACIRAYPKKCVLLIIVLIPLNSGHAFGLFLLAVMGAGLGS